MDGIINIIKSDLILIILFNVLETFFSHKYLYGSVFI